MKTVSQICCRVLKQKRQQDRTEECNPNEPNDKINKSTSKLSPIKSKVKQTKETEISRRNTGRRFASVIWVNILSRQQEHTKKATRSAVTGKMVIVV
ncbi:unnamed protein product [Rhizophagus irregularis]|uniref:Uncharacterized protein n=1 Tax=Rhizophagus irregularis TaxID=588596 RepID=A0A915ZCJ8_9GLOM|nr:unnamed protein product [Rhizophagus irregularis]